MPIGHSEQEDGLYKILRKAGFLRPLRDFVGAKFLFYCEDSETPFTVGGTIDPFGVAWNGDSGYIICSLRLPALHFTDTVQKVVRLVELVIDENRCHMRSSNNEDYFGRIEFPSI